MLYHTIFWLLTLLDTKEEPKRKPEKPQEVTILMPAFNEEKHLEQSAESVLKLDYPKEKLQIIIVNDGSKDSTADIAKRIKQKNPDRNITILTIPNQGKWKALNIGLAKAKGKFFACLDADSFVKPNSLKKALPHFNDPKTAVVLPILKVYKPKTLIQKIQWYEYLVNMFYKKLISNLNCVHVAPGPFSIYRTDVLKKIGGFKKAHFTEDLEIVLRLQEKQYKIIQTSDSEVYTTTPNTIKDVYKQRYRWFRGSLLNVWDYKRLLLNPTYGDFGIFQAPFVLITGFISATLILTTAYFTLLKPLWNGTTNMLLINFDLIPIITNLTFNANILDLDYYKITIATFFIALSLLIGYLSHKYTNEKILKHGIKPALTFLFLYYILLAIFWLKLFADLILKKEQTW